MAAAATKASFGVRIANRFTTRYNKIAKYYEAKMPIVKKYAMQELKPPTMAELPQLKKEVGQLIAKGTSGQWKELTTWQVFMNAVVVWEIFCWYCLGEMIGKRKISGYDAGYGSYARGSGLIDPVLLPEEFYNYPVQKN